MSATATLQSRIPEDAHLSLASQEAARPLRRLLTFGREMGLPTSMTEAGLFFGAVPSRFQELADTWRKDTRYLSSTHEMVLHPAYQEIIGMGWSALPFILKELRREPDHWFWALRAISGEDPVPPEDKGDLRAMTHHWLEWAERGTIGGAY